MQNSGFGPVRSLGWPSQDAVFVLNGGSPEQRQQKNRSGVSQGTPPSCGLSLNPIVGISHTSPLLQRVQTVSSEEVQKQRDAEVGRRQSAHHLSFHQTLNVRKTNCSWSRCSICLPCASYRPETTEPQKSDPSSLLMRTLAEDLKGLTSGAQVWSRTWRVMTLRTSGEAI